MENVPNQNPIFLGSRYKSPAVEMKQLNKTPNRVVCDVNQPFWNCARLEFFPKRFLKLLTEAVISTAYLRPTRILTLCGAFSSRFTPAI